MQYFLKEMILCWFTELVLHKDPQAIKPEFIIQETFRIWGSL